MTIGFLKTRHGKQIKTKLIHHILMTHVLYCFLVSEVFMRILGAAQIFFAVRRRGPPNKW